MNQDAAIMPDIVGYDETVILLDTDLTPTELSRVKSLELALKQAELSILEKHILQGEVLFKIQQEKLYRSREPGERFTWEQYLEKFTPPLTRNGRGFGLQPAQQRCLLYLFHSGQIPAQLLGPKVEQELPLPTSLAQMFPLLGIAPTRNPAQGGGFDLDGNWAAVIEIWKAANSKRVHPRKKDVEEARLEFEARLRIEGQGPAVRIPIQPKSDPDDSDPKAPADKDGSDSQVDAGTQPSTAEGSDPINPPPKAPAPSPDGIAGWGAPKDDGALDPGQECERVSKLLRQADESVRNLVGTLYHRWSEYGNEYFEALRRIDAGVYSVPDIDQRVYRIKGEIEQLIEILSGQLDPGELSSSAIDVDPLPTREHSHPSAA